MIKDTRTRADLLRILDEQQELDDLEIALSAATPEEAARNLREAGFAPPTEAELFGPYPKSWGVEDDEDEDEDEDEEDEAAGSPGKGDEAPTSGAILAVDAPVVEAIAVDEAPRPGLRVVDGGGEGAAIRPKGRSAWRGVGTAAAVTTFALAAGFLLWIGRDHPTPIAFDPVDAAARRDPEADEIQAWNDRNRAKLACDSYHYEECERLLDEARELYPAGESDPEIARLRKRIRYEREGPVDASWASEKKGPAH